MTGKLALGAGLLAGVVTAIWQLDLIAGLVMGLIVALIVLFAAAKPYVAAGLVALVAVTAISGSIATGVVVAFLIFLLVAAWPRSAR